MNILPRRRQGPAASPPSSAALCLAIPVPIVWTGPPSWPSTLGRIAAARLRVRLDDREAADGERTRGDVLAMPCDAPVIPAPELEK